MEMKKYKLGDLGNVCMCKRILKEQTNTVSGIPFYKIGTFGGTADVYIDRKTFETYKELYNYPKKGDILISAAGTIGRTVIFDGSESYFQDSNIVWINNDESQVLNKYLFYCYKNLKWFTSKGSTILRLYNDNIRNSEIIAPNISDQQKIVAVLSSLDDKIALNNRINAKLEQMAKRLYDYWFVQFDFPRSVSGEPCLHELSRTDDGNARSDFPGADGKPYKSSGGKMVWNEELKREIPEGWEVKSVNDISVSYRGVGYTSDDEKSEIDENVVLILRGNNISNNHIVFDSNTVYLDKTFVSPDQEIHKFDLVMTMSSGSKEHVGKSAMFLYDSPHSYGAFCNKITPNIDCQYFLENYLHSEYIKKYIQVTCSGTGINNLTNEHFDKAKFVFPSDEVLKAFNEKMKAIYDKRGILEQENLKLTSMRDKLLPLLMNGQVVVE